MDKLERWLQTGGTLRLVELSADQAVVDLFTCTGELMERYSTADPSVVSRLHAEQLCLPTRPELETHHPDQRGC